MADWGAVCQSQRVVELSGFYHMIRKVTDRHMSGVSLHGGPEGPLCEAKKVKPGWPWRAQYVGDARAVGYLSRRDV